MRFALHSRILTTVLAAVVALTTLGAAPASADRDDQRAVRTIATLLGLAVVGKIIHDSNKDKQKVHQNTRRQTYNPPRQRIKPKPLPPRVSRKLLPQHCFRSAQTRRGRVHMFGQRCLERSYRAVHRLPHACAIRIRTDQGVRRGYEARCLRRNGYSLARG